MAKGLDDATGKIRAARVVSAEERESRYLKVYLVRAQTASSDAAYGPVRTLGDPYTDVGRAVLRKTHWLGGQS